jgi:hypothetical protein
LAQIVNDDLAIQRDSFGQLFPRQYAGQQYDWLPEAILPQGARYIETRNGQTVCTKQSPGYRKNSVPECISLDDRTDPGTAGSFFKYCEIVIHCIEPNDGPSAETHG